MPSLDSLCDTKPTTVETFEEHAVQLKTLDRPFIRKITFGDMADPTVQAIVVRLIQSAMPGPLLRDDEWVAQLSSGGITAYWILTEEGQQAGVIAVQFGLLPDGRRCFYIVAAAAAPHVSDDGWRRLFDFGRVIAKTSGCHVMQFDTTENNQRVQALGVLLGASREAIVLANGAPGWRFTVGV